MGAAAQIVAIPLVVALLALGCERDPNAAAQVRVLPQKSSGREVTVRFGTDPNPPRSGDNDAVITVLENGAAVRDAAVSVRFYMPAMPSMKMPEMHTDMQPALQPDGTYRGSFNLVMAGTWNVTVSVSHNGQEQGAVEYTVIAK